jgi:DNA replication protein DnaC
VNAALCEECGLAAPEWNKSYCSVECFDTAKRKRGEARAEIWVQEWIPKAYQESSIERLPDPEATKLLLDLDLLWHDENGKTVGAYCYGETGSGKTRSVILKLRRLLTSFEDVAYLRGKQFGDEVVERTRPNGRGGFEAWFRNLCDTTVLALDEIDKISFTPRVLAELFELIEHRTSDESPTLFIAQCSIDRLPQKMGAKAKEEAVGILRRIRENSIPIHFSKP